MVNRKGGMWYSQSRVSQEEIAMQAFEEDFKGCIYTGLAHNMLDGILGVMDVKPDIDHTRRYVTYTASAAILNPYRYHELLKAEDTLNKYPFRQSNPVVSKVRMKELLKAEQDLRELRKIVRG